MSGRWLATLLVGAVLAVAACSGSSPDPGAGAPEVTTPPTTEAPTDATSFAVIAGDEALASRDAEDGLPDPLRTLWAQQVYAEGLPTTATFVNFAQPDATAAVALDLQVPSALEVDPSLVVVWLGTGDAAVGTTPEAFGTTLTDILDELRAAAVTELVVVASTDGPGAVYGEAVAAAAADAGAELVTAPGDPAAWRDPAVQDEIAAAVDEAIDR